MNKEEIWSQLSRDYSNSFNRSTPPPPGRVGLLEQNGTITMTISPGDLHENMQEDNACFEGWACILKAWFSQQRIQLDWERPENINKINEGHYQRFLYRAKRFTEFYGHWFSLVRMEYLADLKIKDGQRYPMNCPKGERASGIMPTSTLDCMTEKELEQAILSSGPKERLMDFCSLKNLSHHLPVGVFSDPALRAVDRIFPGGAGQIDLWGLGGDSDRVAHIFELKKSGVKKVGVLSELFFYAMVIRDLQRGTFLSAPQLDALSTTKKLRADILCPHAHPFFDQDARVFSVLNAPSVNGDTCDVRFGWIKVDGAFGYERKW